MRDASDVERTAEELKISATLHGSLEDASTVEAAAESLGIEPTSIGKSIVLMVQDEAPVIVVIRGPDQVDMEKVAEHVDADPDEVRMAKPDEVEDHTGYRIGGVPPLGHKRPLRTLLDERLLQEGTLYVGGGSEDVLLEIDAADLRKLPDISTGDFAQA